MLVSKANRLTELNAVVSTEDTATKQSKALRKGLDFYEIALGLMKPFDPNYSTIMNWRCLALIKQGRYSEAVSGYKEIVSISEKTDGKHLPNATAQLAKDQITKYATLEDIVNDGDNESDVNLFDDPPYCMFAGEFCSLLVDRKFKKAHSLLSEAAKEKWSQKAIQSNWESMVDGVDLPDCNLLENLTDWPSRKQNEIGWCYHSVTHDLLNEAIAVVVALTKHNTYQITKIEFGRP